METQLNFKCDATVDRNRMTLNFFTLVSDFDIEWKKNEIESDDRKKIFISVLKTLMYLKNIFK